MRHKALIVVSLIIVLSHFLFVLLNYIGEKKDREKGTGLLRGDIPLQVAVFPIRGFRSTMDKSLPESGTILVWKDASGRWGRFTNTLYKNIIFAVLALLVIEMILIFVWNYSTDRLRKVVAEQAEENYERLNLFIKASPTAILIVDTVTRQVMDLNPQALRLMGVDTNEITRADGFRHRQAHEHYQI